MLVQREHLFLSEREQFFDFPESVFTFQNPTSALIFLTANLLPFCSGGGMPNKRLSMRQLREILRLRLQAEISVRQIQRSLRVSVGAVSKILSKASGLGLNWKDVEALNDIQLANFFLPECRYSPVPPI